VILNIAKRFKNRYAAARQLVPQLKKFAHKKNVLLLAIPRGALEIGTYLAKELALPLDVLLVKKIPAPKAQELAVGAVSIDGGQTVDKQLIKEFKISATYLDRQGKLLVGDLKKRDKQYHAQTKKLPIAGQTVIILDDGIATGQTVRLAIKMLRRQQAAKIVVATPTSSAQAARQIRKEADELITLIEEEHFAAVGMYYVNFPQITDDEAIKLFQAVQ